MIKNTLLNSKKAFTLLELIIVMAVIAVLVILGIQGLFILQKRSRDNLRVNTGSQIADLVNNYRKANLRYPQKLEVVFATDTITIGTNVLTLKNSSKSGTSTTNKTTRYYYNNERGGFVLCVLLESAKVEKLGTLDCPATTSWN